MRVLVLGAGADSTGVPSSAVTEALLALKAGGAEVVLLDSNPATLATDPEVAHRTWLEPVTLEVARRLVAVERPDAVVATLGGETALGLGKQLALDGAQLLGLTLDGLERLDRLNAKVDLGAFDGWRQAELLVLRDHRGAAQIAGGVEFLEPVGIRPEDSLAVTPTQTFGVSTLERMHALALDAAREGAVQGLCSVRLAVRPRDGKVALLQVWPGLAFSVCLLTRATGRPLAAEAAALLLGEPLKSSSQRSAGGWVVVQTPQQVLGFGSRLGEALLRAQHALGGAPAAAWQRALAGGEQPGWAPWFSSELKLLWEQTKRLRSFAGLDEVTEAALWLAKAQGFSDARLAALWNATEAEVRGLRHARGVRPALRPQGDGWALRYDGLADAPRATQRTVVLLGGGAQQGEELGWSCVHASRALRAAGVRVVLLDCTASASPAEFDQVCLGALAAEEVLELCALLGREGEVGVLAQFGGRTALRLAALGAPVLGTAPAQLERAADRARLAEAVQAAGLSQPPRRLALTLDEARRAAGELGYPLIARTAGGTLLLHSESALVTGELEQFLAEATEANVELLRDRTGRVLVAGVLEHVEQAGIHSGDAACTLPPHSLSPEVVERLKDAASALAEELQVVGLLDVRFAVQGKAVFVLEANPRVSRTVPFVAKATGLQLVELAATLALGGTLEELGCTREPSLQHVAVKEAVFPAATDVLLDTQQKSTGAVMGLSESVATAFGKSQLAAGTGLPRSGKVLLSAQDEDQPAVVDLAKRLKALGFTLLTTEGTQAYLATKRVESERGGAAQVRAGEVALLIYTIGATDSGLLRQEALERKVPCFTTVEAARLAVAALEAQAAGERQYRPLQDWLARR